MNKVLEFYINNYEKQELQIRVKAVILLEMRLDDVVMTLLFSALFCCIKAHTRPCGQGDGTMA